MEEGNIEKSSTQLNEDEQVGVKLPFMILIPSMLAVIVTGTIPVTLILWYFLQIMPVFLQSWLSLVLGFLLLPLLFWILYFTYLLVTVLVTKLFLSYYDYKSPPLEEDIRRQFKDTTHPDFKKLHYYHMRGAVIKYSLWVSQKCPFSSFVKRILVFFGFNQIGSGVIYDNCFVGLEFTEIEDNVIIEAGTALSTHVVLSLYGKLQTGKITMKKGAVTGIHNIIGPYSVYQEEFHTGDNAMIYVNWQLETKEGNPNKFFNGRPALLKDFESFFADKGLLEAHREIANNQ
ncbi:MAG: hypothetical protein ACFFCS_13535 [Candidatus Hodarchaeota archaeon]